MIEFLSALGQREAIAFGDGVTLPVRIRFDALPRNACRAPPPRGFPSSRASIGDENFLDLIVEKWRVAGIGAGTDTGVQAAMIADSIELQLASELDAAPARPGARREASLYGAGSRAGASFAVVMLRRRRLSLSPRLRPRGAVSAACASGCCNVRPSALTPTKCRSIAGFARALERAGGRCYGYVTALPGRALEDHTDARAPPPPIEELEP